jgi:hypothetical protein
MTVQMGKKRQREVDDATETINVGTLLHPVQDDPIKKIRSTVSNTSPQTLYIIVHRVECSRVVKYHEHHAPSADYFDAPRLLKQSNRKSRLQGELQIADIETYLEDHQDLSFAVYITYSCTKYHEAIKDEFRRLQMPKMDDHIATEAKPYFYVLERDARPAVAESQALLLSEGLHEALDLLNTEVPAFQWDWEDPSNLVHPYLRLYHQRDFLTGSAMDVSKRFRHRHLEALQDYLAKHLGPEYSEADTLFSNGMVERHHWAKLYLPGAVLVTIESGQPVAHICETCTTLSKNRLRLDYWDWAFDGKFYRNNVILDVQWPSDGNITAIADLEAYPLVHATAGLEDELRSRGKVFWECRARKFANYSVPLEGMEVQIVTISVQLSWPRSLILSGQSAIHDRHGHLQGHAR